MGDAFSVDVWRESIASAVSQLGETLGSLLPAIVGAVLILAIGWIVSKVVQVIARRALAKVGLDRAALRFRVTAVLQRANIASAPSAIVAGFLFWILMLVFVLAATETLGFRAVTTTVERLIAYLPRVIGAALVVAVGFVLGRALQRIVDSGASVAGLPQPEKLAGTAYAIVLLVAAVVAVEQLGLQTDVLVTVLTILVATFGLTMGLAFALGARKLVTHILAGHYLRQSLPATGPVEIAGRRGTVESIGAVNTVLRSEDGSWIVPNARVLDDVVGI
jgi:hypothetical protein